MKITKRFRWEMGHRLPNHGGLCRNLHGHSYSLLVELEGEPDESGMIVDFDVVTRVVKPLITELDHAFLVDTDDTVLIELLINQSMKHVVIPYPSTVENICRMIAENLTPALAGHPTVTAFSLTLFETETASASLTVSLTDG